MENVLWPKYIGYTYMKFSKNKENVFLKGSNKFKKWMRERNLHTIDVWSSSKQKIGPTIWTVTLLVKDTKEMKSKERDLHVYCSVLGNKDVELI